MVAAGLLGLSTVGAVAFSGPASAAPPVTSAGLSPAVRARMAAQVPLIDAASVIRSVVEAGQPRGYAGLGLVKGHVTLWWKGTVPADVTRAVDSARRIAEVKVEPAAYSGTELKTAAAKVSRVVASDPTDAAHTVRIKTDGSGLQVAVDTSAGAKVPALPNTGVKTHSVAAKKPKLHATRDDDEAPWNGGAGISRDGPGVDCTAGFGVRHAGTNTPYVLTAAHCGELGSLWSDGVNEPIGTMVQRHVDHDTALISAESAGKYMYVGGQYDETKVPVVGWTQVFPGQLLCQSGYTTSWVVGHPICNLEVQFHYTDRQDLVEATQLDGLESGYGGDSGGPVYMVNPDGSVLAAGTHTSGAGPGIGFQDFATARADFGDIVPVDNSGTASTCRVSYQVANRWPGGYTVNVTLYNSGSAINGWRLNWDLGAGSTVTIPWNAATNQSGATVTASNLAYNATIPAGGAITFGFNASGTPNTPASFTLNGQTCA
ncbi:cellulose binding domain-containing protein [Plantactinospora soyae]|uniref:CBM2 domain-containing protein n=1 Tax=Plantactinospora soyae TaxID=1544732 RepID=A0A927MCD5_9ACTN|nr:cellulose binding domain-containing protein [Plantactinospora soyae]MBE1491015.1 hypothetical protein [Plantactinospora soyae]